MKVSGITTFRQSKDLPKDEVVLIHEANIIIGAYVPYEIWAQLQAFVGRVIERV